MSFTTHEFHLGATGPNGIETKRKRITMVHPRFSSNPNSYFGHMEFGPGFYANSVEGDIHEVDWIRCPRPSDHLIDRDTAARMTS